MIDGLIWTLHCVESIDEHGDKHGPSDVYTLDD